MSWRIYVAGPISNTDPCVMLKNIGEGIRQENLLNMVMCPFVLSQIFYISFQSHVHPLKKFRLFL